jgi:hypothetical protein
MFGFGKHDKDTQPSIENSDAEMLRAARKRIEETPVLAGSKDAFSLFDRYNDKGELAEDGQPVDIMDKLDKLEARLLSEGVGATPAEQVTHSAPTGVRETVD